MSRRHQIQRQWEIVRYLETGAAPTLGDLADVVSPPGAEAREAGRKWSESTLRRDLEDLIEAGFPILRQRQGGVRWRFPEGFRNAVPGPFRLTELMALHYARAEFDAFRETPFDRTFRSLLETAERYLPAAMREFLDRIDRVFRPYWPSLKSLAAHQRVLEEVAQAVDERRCLEVLYLPAGRRRAAWRRMDPYGVWYHLGRTLLMAYHHETRTLDLVPVESIREVRKTKDVFQLPLEIDFRSVLMGKGEALAGAGGGGPEVVVRCVGEAAVRVREAIGLGGLPGASFEESAPSGTAVTAGPAGGTEDEDAGGVVRFSAEDLDGVRAWVLSLGGGAEVLSPPELRRAVAAELRSAGARYRSPGRPRKDADGP